MIPLKLFQCDFCLIEAASFVFAASLVLPVIMISVGKIVSFLFKDILYPS